MLLQSNLVIYKILTSLLQVFNGNSERNDIVKHNLKEITRARFIRFQPTSYSTRKALRVEVFGVLKPAGILLLVIIDFHIFCQTTETNFECFFLNL